MKANSKGASASTAKPILKLGPVVRLFEPQDYSVDQDYVDFVRALLLRAERGESTGLAYVETTSTKGGKKGYQVGARGILDENPAFCLGTIEVLKAKLIKKVMG